MFSNINEVFLESSTYQNFLNSNCCLHPGALKEYPAQARVGQCPGARPTSSDLGALICNSLISAVERALCWNYSVHYWDLKALWDVNKTCKNETKQSGPKSEYVLNQTRSGALLLDRCWDVIKPVTSTKCVHQLSVSVEKRKRQKIMWNQSSFWQVLHDVSSVNW